MADGALDERVSLCFKLLHAFAGRLQIGRCDQLSRVVTFRPSRDTTQRVKLWRRTAASARFHDFAEDVEM